MIFINVFFYARSVLILMYKTKGRFFMPKTAPPRVFTGFYKLPSVRKKTN